MRLAAIIVVLMVRHTAVAASAADRQAEDLAEAVVAGIAANYSHVRTLEAIVERTLEDATATKAETKRVDLPGGAQATFTVAPRQTWMLHLYVKGESVRCDYADVALGRLQEFALRDGVWTQYVPESRTAWKRLASGMPSIPPLDVRQAGSPDIRYSLTSILRQQRILSARTQNGKGNGSTIEIVTDGPSEPQELRFDPSFGFLPTQRVTRHQDGSVCVCERLTYQPVLGGAAWVLRESAQSFFEPGVTRQPTDVGWKQRQTTGVKSIRLLNGDIADSVFVLEISADTRVRDSSSPPASRAASGFASRVHLKTVLASLTLIVICGGLLVAVRRLRSRAKGPN